MCPTCQFASESGVLNACMFLCIWCACSAPILCTAPIFLLPTFSTTWLTWMQLNVLLLLLLLLLLNKGIKAAQCQWLLGHLTSRRAGSWLWQRWQLLANRRNTPLCRLTRTCSRSRLRPSVLPMSQPLLIRMNFSRERQSREPQFFFGFSAFQFSSSASMQSFRTTVFLSSDPHISVCSRLLFSSLIFFLPSEV